MYSFEYRTVHMYVLYAEYVYITAKYPPLSTHQKKTPSVHQKNAEYLAHRNVVTSFTLYIPAELLFIIIII